MRPLLLAALLATIPATAYADPWAQAPGEHYLRLASRIVIGTGGYMADGAYVDVGQMYIDTGFNLYAEYGIGEVLTIIGSTELLGYATMGERATAYMGTTSFTARLTLPAITEAVEELQVALEIVVGLNPGFGNRRIAAGLLREKIWEYAPGYESNHFGANLRLGYRFGWGTFALVDAGLFERTRPRDLGPIFAGAVAIGLESAAGADLVAAFLWHQPAGSVGRNNFSGASGTRYIGARVTLTLWLADGLGLYLGAEGYFLAQAARPGPFITAGLVQR